ncbi:hypothetical protein HBB16_04375 [Pseudonocardia sp. MCCB 268]|nr:hypothetical protein [Pseudonocardia cytotoxica]
MNLPTAESPCNAGPCTSWPASTTDSGVHPVALAGCAYLVGLFVVIAAVVFDRVEARQHRAEMLAEVEAARTRTA